MHFSTAELCDRYADQRHIQIAEPIFKTFGGISAFFGQIATLKTFEDDVLIGTALSSPGKGRVLVVDGGGSHRCSLIDGRLGKLAVDNGWSGIVVYGCIRNTHELSGLPLGLRALHAHPMKAHQRGSGDRDSLITFGSVNFRSGNHIYVDDDGMVVADDELI